MIRPPLPRFIWWDGSVTSVSPSPTSCCVTFFLIIDVIIYCYFITITTIGINHKNQSSTSQDTTARSRPINNKSSNYNATFACTSSGYTSAIHRRQNPTTPSGPEPYNAKRSTSLLSRPADSNHPLSSLILSFCFDFEYVSIYWNSTLRTAPFCWCHTVVNDSSRVNFSVRVSVFAYRCIFIFYSERPSQKIVWTLTKQRIKLRFLFPSFPSVVPGWRE